MTVAELIAELQKLDPSLVALVSGYEGGYCDISPSFEACVYKRDCNDKDTWYYGPHEELESDDEWQGPTFYGVHIG